MVRELLLFGSIVKESLGDKKYWNVLMRVFTPLESSANSTRRQREVHLENGENTTHGAVVT